MNNILIIGGSYFLGRVFVEELSQRDGYAIYVMNRGNAPLNMEGVEEIVCDRHDAFSIGGLVPDLNWHAVVDFCAYEPDDIDLLLYNLPGAMEQYVYISTATVYENSPDVPMKEDAAKLTGPLPGPHGDYAYKKWLAEIKLKELCEERGIAHTSLRPAFIYGKYNYAPRESYFFDLIAENEPIVLPPAPQVRFSMVSVWDVASICMACLGNERVFNGAFNVASEELVWYDRLIEVLEEIAGRSFDVRRMSIADIDRRGIPLPFPLEEQLIYSGELLQGILGYEYMPFAEGMRRTYNWYFKLEGA
ncbi:MAG: NAD-dependent epimerase/dehydratase family protein [Chloroflexota bacterium]|nr:NAD-dependent epimerase/dehydratase family protein [Chloroflexota bacterium]